MEIRINCITCINVVQIVSSFHFYIYLLIFFIRQNIMTDQITFCKFIQASKTVFCFVRDYTILYDICIIYITMCQDTFTQIFVHAAKYMYICTGTLKPVNNHLINNSLNGLCQSNNSIKPVIKFDMIFFICVHHMTADGYNTSLFKLLIKIHNADSRSIFLSDCF